LLKAGRLSRAHVPAGRVKYQGLPPGSKLAEQILAEQYFTFSGKSADRENLAEVACSARWRKSPLIVTTNYDRVMEAALRLEGKEEGKDFITLMQPLGIS